MKEVAVYEAKTRLSELLSIVEQGEQVTITRRGLPIARLISAAPVKRAAPSQRLQVAAVFAKLKAVRSGLRLDGDLKAIISEGRD